MAECACGNCEHCGAPTEPALPELGRADLGEEREIKLLESDGNSFAVPASAATPTLPPSSGCPVRDLADAIRGIAMALATGYPHAQLVDTALVLANLHDGTHGCDTCRK